MKTIKNIGLVVLGLGALILAACAPRMRSHGHHRLPPGQVKKVSGSQSARPYAPGQMKKSGSPKHHGNRRGHHKK